jgi:transposase
MYTGLSFGIPERFHAEVLAFEGGGVTVLASTRSTAARCSLCGCISRRPHSSRTRTLADLPWGGVPVRFRVRIRGFFCGEPGCPRRIFAERLDGVAERYARRTRRQRKALDLIAFALGGEAGARLPAELGLRISIDDWALKRAQTYGTILAELERHQVVDPLPDRSSDALAAWLRDRTGVELIARDGANAYADGATRGAPDPLQVADRFRR